MLKNKVFYKNDVSDNILMVLPRASDKVLNNLKGLPLCELVTFETTPHCSIFVNYQSAETFVPATASSALSTTRSTDLGVQTNVVLTGVGSTLPPRE